MTLRYSMCVLIVAGNALAGVAAWGQQCYDTSGRQMACNLLTTSPQVIVQAPCIAATSDPNYKCPPPAAFAPASEPLSVPAVRKFVRKAEWKTPSWGTAHNGYWSCGGYFTYDYGEDSTDIENVNERPSCYTHWTCTDKRRVLLTDESGARHCVLFEDNK